MWLLKLLKGWQLYAIIFSVGVASGIWGMAKFHKAEKIAELEKIIELKDAAYNKALTVSGAFYKKQLEISDSQVKVREVIKHVKDDSTCDIPAPTAWMLDAHRSGMSQGTTGTFEGSRIAPTTDIVSQSQELTGHFDIADRFILCREQIIQLKEFYK